MKKVVLTAIFGDRDSLRDPVLSGHNPDWDYVCFTDNPTITSNVWDVRVVENALGRHTARHIKLMTHEWIKFDILLWLDASTVLRLDPDQILADMGDANLYLKLHPRVATLDGECDFAVKAKRLSEDKAESIKLHYHQLGYTPQIQDRYQTYETGLHMRRNTSRMFEFMRKWWREVSEVTELRDQIPLSYLIWKHNPGIKTYTPDEFDAYGTIYKHLNEDDLYLPIVRYFQPFDNLGNLGAAYNECQEGLADEDWICIMDQDVCVLDSRVKKWIARTIQANPNVQVFVPVTNRLSAYDQRVNNAFSVVNIVWHKSVTVKRHNTFKYRVRKPTQTPAGMMVIMQAHLLREFPFRNGLMYIDTDWFQRIEKAGVSVGIMEGVYVFHYYRLTEGKSSLDHLLGWNDKG